LLKAKKTFLIITWSILMLPDAGAQTKNGIENYNFLSSGENYVWMPVVHHLGKKRWYTEMRYNYEDINSASVYIGKSFCGNADLNYTITPMLGVVFGTFKGSSLALNLELKRRKLFVCMQTQYTINTTEAAKSFFFNWAELCYQSLEWFYAGLSTQFTKPYKENVRTEYGFVTGLVIKKFSIPVYVFNPLRGKKNYIVGINVEW
jgi:hypothetical protein